uniref:Uncharacterized protein n=1 Tax=Cacopsylla melanoneura TaxID=428564 RepID=A0A8D9BJ20_9HEMI
MWAISPSQIYPCGENMATFCARPMRSGRRDYLCGPELRRTKYSLSCVSTSEVLCFSEQFTHQLNKSMFYPLPFSLITHPCNWYLLFSRHLDFVSSTSGSCIKS